MDNAVQKIEKLRQDLIDIGVKRGFQDPQVMEKSRMLDELINQYYRIPQQSAEVKAAS